MKMQKSPIFVKKALKIIMGKIIAFIQGNIVILRIALVI